MVILQYIRISQTFCKLFIKSNVVYKIICFNNISYNVINPQVDGLKLKTAPTEWNIDLIWKKTFIQSSNPSTNMISIYHCLNVFITFNKLWHSHLSSVLFLALCVLGCTLVRKFIKIYFHSQTNQTIEILDFTSKWCLALIL